MIKSSQVSPTHSLGTDEPKRRAPVNACDSHMHIFDPRFAPSPHWRRSPPDAPVSSYRLLQQRLGTSRAVIVTPSTYGTDNRCTLDALTQMGDSARGVAVVDHHVTDAELDFLAANRVCGLRVNFVTPQPWGRTTQAMLTELARKVERLGWHIQVFLEADQLVELQPCLASLPVPLVVDHLGRIDPREGADALAFRALRFLLDKGDTWVKLSGAYMLSLDGEPHYRDTWALGQALVKAAPERLVWGSDWPHTTQPFGSVNDASLLNLLGVWAVSHSIVDRVLVDNAARLYGFDSPGGA